MHHLKVIPWLCVIENEMYVRAQVFTAVTMKNGVF
jgi:hypothetical protein